MQIMSTSALPLQQHPHFAACLAAQGRLIERRDNGQSLVRRFGPLSVSLISRGHRDMVQGASNDPRVTLFTPDHPIAPEMKAAGFVKIAGPATVAEWDIDRPLPLIHQSLKKVWRAQLRKACPLMHITARPMPNVSDHWLLTADAKQSETRKYRNLPHWIALQWARSYPEKTLLLEARTGTEPIAAMLFLLHGSVATYHISHTTAAGRNAEAHRMMLWQAVEKLKRRGIKRIDLGLVDTEAASGLARFKLGTGATARPLGGTWLALPGLKSVVAYFNRQSPSGQKA